MNQAAEEIRARLFALRDPKYHDFLCKLIPTADPDTIIGVRMPVLRALAKELRGTPTAAEFLRELPHGYYEERNLHALLIQRGSYEAVLAEVKRLVPYMDNWATCDLLRPKAFAKHTAELLPEIRSWLQSGETYTVRFGINMLMAFYLDDAFSPEYPELVAACACGDYYIDMICAWYFAEALAKQPETIRPFFEQRRLPKWTHNKAIQKCVESFKISAEEKEALKAMREK